MELNLEAAKKVVAGAEAKAKAIGVPMNIAVVDVGGNLVAIAAFLYTYIHRVYI